MKTDKASKAGRAKKNLSLLLYLESRAVDQGGLVDILRMNAADMRTAEQWHENGYIFFGRRRMAEIQGMGKQGWTHLVRLTPAAMRDAHAERHARACRSESAEVAEKFGAAKPSPRTGGDARGGAA